MTPALPSVQWFRQRAPNEAWDLAVAPPPPDLADLVLRFAGFEEFLPSPALRRELPRPMAVVVISFGAPFDLTYEHPQDRYAVRRGSFVAGLHERTATNRSTGRSHCLQFDLTPLGARLLFGVPMAELGNRIVALDEVLGAAARRLEEQLYDLPDWPARFALVAGMVRRRLTACGGPAADMLWAWRQLQARGGTLPVAALSQGLSVSRRHLVQRFRDQIGLPPKILSRMLRFNRALDALQAGQRDLAGVALAAGYYDQAHFNRDFRAFAGESPGRWLAGR